MYVGELSKLARREIELLTKDAKIEKALVKIANRDLLALARAKDIFHFLIVRQRAGKGRTRSAGRELNPFGLGFAAVLGRNSGRADGQKHNKKNQDRSHKNSSRAKNFLDDFDTIPHYEPTRNKRIRSILQHIHLAR